VYIPVKHVCNSAALIEFPEMHLNMVRPGIALYGLYPSDEVDKTKIDLRPAMSLKANVILVKDVEKDTFISYGRIFKTSRNSRIATIPIGYATDIQASYRQRKSTSERSAGSYCGKNLHGSVHGRHNGY